MEEIATVTSQDLLNIKKKKKKNQASANNVSASLFFTAFTVSISPSAKRTLLEITLHINTEYVWNCFSRHRS